MFSNRLILVAALAALLPACGNKEPPQAPPLKIPAPPQDLAIQQRGNEILLTLSYPTVTVAGLAIEEFQGIEFWRLDRALPPLAEPGAEGEEPGAEVEDAGEDGDSPGDSGEPEGAIEADALETAAGEAGDEEAGDDEGMGESSADAETGASSLEDTPAAPLIPLRPEDRVQVELLEFSVTAKLERTLQGPELEAATVGDKIVARFSVVEGKDEEELASLFSTRVLAGKRLISNWSNLAVLVPRPPPPPPADLTVQATGDGVLLSWTSDFEDATGFRVYRRDARSRGYAEALRQLPSTLLNYVDRTAAYGNSYIYTVTSVAEVNPLVESAFAAEHEVNYEDRFAPPAPRNLVALAQRGSVRLLWDASPAEDVLGYFVQRRQGRGEPVTLNEEPIRQLEFTDKTAASGQGYLYSVVAIDQIGNRGEASEETDVRVP